MQKVNLSFSKLYKFVKKCLKKETETSLKRGRPQRYEDAFILALWLYQNLKKISYREVLKEVKQLGFPTPALSTYHYRVSKLPSELTQKLLSQVEKKVLYSK